MRLLDLFSGAGGAGMGYSRAGFDVTGVDIKPQQRYPFEFVQADALEYVAMHGHEFDVIHASPPCQKWAIGTQHRGRHPDLISPVRKILQEIGKPYVIENVPKAPVRPDIVICGCQVGLPLIRRVRHFEVSAPIFGLLPSCHHDGPVITVTGSGTPSGTRASWGRNITVAEKRCAMGIEWMATDELSQAIPPAYTEWIGKHLMEELWRTNGWKESLK